MGCLDIAGPALPRLAAWHSIPVGVVTLAERHGSDRISAQVYETMVEEVRVLLLAFEAAAGLASSVAAGGMQMLGTSGTVTTLCGVHLDLPRYDRSIVDGSYLDFATIDKVSADLAAMGWDERAAIPCIGRERADLVVAGCAILAAICRIWPVGRLRVADRGVREGILFGLLANGAEPRATQPRERAPTQAQRARPQRTRPDAAGAHRKPPPALLGALAGAAVERSLRRRGAAPGLSLARRVQADPARRSRGLPRSPAGNVVDLGAAPGGWTQVAVERCRPTGGRQGRVVGIDLTPMDPIAGAELLEGDFLTEDAPARLKAALGGPADVVLSDMAAPATGHAKTDHLRIIALAEAAHEFAREVLRPGGVFVTKVLQGGTSRELLDGPQARFRRCAPCEAGGEPGRFGGDLCRRPGLPEGRIASPFNTLEKFQLPLGIEGAICMMARHYPFRGVAWKFARRLLSTTYFWNPPPPPSCRQKQTPARD